MPVLTEKDKLPNLQAYEVLSKIGSGSMATVYRARHRQTGDLVALKVPLPIVAANPVLFTRFQEEFRVGNQLHHPGLVRSLELCREDGTFYLVMELVDGPDLWHRLQQHGPLAEADAVRVIVQVAEGLHEAHRHGIIHRDVKPDNILLGADGTAKIGDLGLLKDLEGELGLTQADKGLGSPNFIAPEQFTDACHAGVACDIYSLAATLYTALTGELPFPGRSLASILNKKLHDELVPPRQLVPALSERVDWVIRRALQAKPELRHASCTEFVQALVAEGPVPPPPPEVRQALDGGRRRPASGERRRSVRYPCTLATVCEVDPSIHEGYKEEGEAPERWEGTIQNLSVSGILLLLSRRFEPGTVVHLALQSPAGDYRRNVGLHVLHVRKARGGLWSTGARFTEELTREELQKLL